MESLTSAASFYHYDEKLVTKRVMSSNCNIEVLGFTFFFFLVDTGLPTCPTSQSHYVSVRIAEVKFPNVFRSNALHVYWE